GHHGRRQLGADAALAVGLGAHPHRQHRPRDGLRGRRPPGGALRHRDRALRDHHGPEHHREPGARETEAARGATGGRDAHRGGPGHGPPGPGRGWRRRRQGAEMRPRRRLITPRQAQAAARAVLWTMMAATVAVLVFIIFFVMKNGLAHITWTFLTAPPRESGREGGVLPIIVGTLWVTALAVVIATPLGLGTAIYLTEYTRESPLTRAVRFGADCLAGVPSIIFGLFGFVFFVLTLQFGW